MSDGDNSLGFDLQGGSGEMSTPAGSYRVLARKYRPSTFDDLIGQEAMVRTLANAFDTGRIPQAWILTGVRGVGKTTTARILARALNYDADGIDKPSIHMPKLGTHCQAIMESRHVDVIEMDAASHNGVDDIRQINDAVRYAPASARYKVYILDEVHMVTAQGFNALLKTLEEPPPHVKFVFATTEIRKVPITVLSRCQRFDLRRVEAGTLVDHLGNICTKEKVEAETDALQLIARAAEGSVRDSLSLMDQAIAHAAGPVRAEDVRQMLGLADRTRVIDLFAALMRGDIASALGELRDQYDSGADPAVALTDLAEFTHFVTRIKVVPSIADDRSIAEVERSRGAEFAASLSMRVLSMTWQMLLKGIAEVRESSKPIQAAEMVLVRIGYAAGLPSPEDLLNGGGVGAPSAPAGGGGGSAPSGGGGQRPRAMSNAQPRAMHAVESSPAVAAPRASAQTAPMLALARFEDVIALATQQRDILMRTALERDVRLVRFEDGRLEIALEPGASKAIVNDLAQKLKNWTGRPWMIVLSSEQGEASLRAKEDARREEVKTGVTADPLVQAVLSRFPGAQIVGVQVRGEAIEQTAFTPPPNEDGDIAPWDDGAPPNEGESFDD